MACLVVPISRLDADSTGGALAHGTVDAIAGHQAHPRASPEVPVGGSSRAASTLQPITRPEPAIEGVASAGDVQP
jgi:hypothetical protein